MKTNVIYLRPSRTIEISRENKRSLYTYNYEGEHFRVFKFKDDLREFFRIENSHKYIFDTENEDELDKFLEDYLS
jgi:hypothetical protein